MASGTKQRTRVWHDDGDRMDQSKLLEELDQRQNDVLDQLATLNSRIEAFLQECLAERDQACQGTDVDAPASAPASQVTLSGRGARTSQSPVAAGDRPAR